MMQVPDFPVQIQAYQPQVALVLGSGLGFLAEQSIELEGELPYADIPGFPVSTVDGHVGRFVYGLLDGVRVLCMQGRVHYYEGYSMQAITLPIRMMAKLGIRRLCLSNAAGGINPVYRPGDFMILRDHINFLGSNPLIGPVQPEEIRFPDMSAVYDPLLRDSMLAWAESKAIRLHQGVYLATTGPSFETPAEIRAFASLGADAVGMSTVPEAIVARALGMRVTAISCITNAAAGLSDAPLTHEEVSETAGRVQLQFEQLVRRSVRILND
ncbi:purine-nucleoside phosphorylase [Coraliomargarita akajimensis]|uniref:Purine nucleoside phosphorylase n=1 Tax=Coraliomargarita akajimensis (strain DSM 45221 / IAM 15411 / JCM 23193 / KCTC 12865 / 04OKA010-24) TaxID=583355 RepID=D5EI01_CORAD|nr:purine-nucleoside phosphorylase [Coraliomargarita akajimensis]ADE56041.1 inosine guanosine and xanthosine phosphorylase family [Coraliomargarita akajimensis DSM 45221]